MTGDVKLTKDQRFDCLMWCIMESKGTRKRVRKDFWPGFAQKYESIFGKSISPNGMRKKYFRWRIKMENESTPDTLTFFLKPKRRMSDKFCDWLSDITSLIIRIFSCIIDWFIGINSEEYSVLMCHFGTHEKAEEGETHNE